MENKENKALWIFPNIKEIVDSLPDDKRGTAWRVIIDYAFGGKEVNVDLLPFEVKIAFLAVKPVLCLRGVGGAPKKPIPEPQGELLNNSSTTIKKTIPQPLNNYSDNSSITPLITETETPTGIKTETENPLTGVGAPAREGRQYDPLCNPPDIDDIAAYAMVACQYPDRQDCEKFLNHYKGTGWLIKPGVYVYDWREKLKNWIVESRNRKAAAMAKPALKGFARGNKPL